MKDLLVQDWMTQKVITLDPRTTLPVAHRLMVTNRIRRLPVVKARRPIGIITRSDLREASPADASELSIWELHYLLSKLEIQQMMTTDPICIPPDASIKEAARLMYQHKIGGLPVIGEDGKLVGIITESDIFRILIAWFDEQEESGN